MLSIQPSRRGFLFGLLAAPAIVRASSLMAVKPFALTGLNSGLPLLDEPEVEMVIGEWRGVSFYEYSVPNEQFMTRIETHGGAAFRFAG